MKIFDKPWIKRIAFLTIVSSQYSSFIHAQAWTQYDNGTDFYINTGHKLFKGDFNGDGQDSVMAFTSLNQYDYAYLDTSSGTNQWVHTLPTTIPAAYSNQNMLIGNWPIKVNDWYITGDFNGDGKDEILAINPDGNYQTLSYDSNNLTWSTISSRTNGVIRNDDQYFVGDFDGDGRQEILAIYANGWHRTLKFNVSTSNWDIIQGNNSGAIHWWNLNSNDKYAVGDFNGDGKDEFLAANSSGWHHTMQLDANNNWQYLEGGSNGFIAMWYISNGDKFGTGDFNCDGQDELLAINSNNGWSQTMYLNTNGWPHWQLYPNLSNNGNFLFASWPINDYDWLATGQFGTSNCDVALNVNADWDISVLNP